MRTRINALMTIGILCAAPLAMGCESDPLGPERDTRDNDNREVLASDTRRGGGGGGTVGGGQDVCDVNRPIRSDKEIEVMPVCPR